MAVDVFSVPIFFMMLRETIEAGIIVSVLLAFLKQTLGRPDQDETTYRALVKQVWISPLAMHSLHRRLQFGGSFG